MSDDALAAVRSRVVDDPQLIERLLATCDLGTFVQAVVEIGGGLGVDLTPADVQDALGAAWGRHLGRWV